MKKVYGYGRGSTDEQVETLLVQEERCKREYDYKFAPQGFTWGGMFLDKGVPGSIPMARRDAGFRLCNTIETSDVIIITKLDRGFRSAADFFNQLARWKRDGINLVLLDMGLDTTTPVGMMIAGIMAVISEFERARLRERTSEGLRSRGKRGMAISAHPPYGWKKQKPPNGGKTVLVPDPRIRELGKKFLQWKEGGWSREQIYIHLWKNKVWRDTRGKEYSPAAIDRMAKKERLLQQLEAQGMKGQALLDAYLHNIRKQRKRQGRYG